MSCFQFFREKSELYLPLILAVCLLAAASDLELRKWSQPIQNGILSSKNDELVSSVGITTPPPTTKPTVAIIKKDIDVIEKYSGDPQALPWQETPKVVDLPFLKGVDKGEVYKQGIYNWTTHETKTELDVSNGDLNQKNVWEWDEASQRNLELEWYTSPAQVCNLLNQFSIEFVGQSTERRLLYTLESMAYGISAAFANDGAPLSTVQKIADTRQVARFVPERRYKYCRPGLRHLSFVAGQYGIRSIVYNITSELHAAQNTTISRIEPTPRKVILVNYGLYGLTRRNIRLGSGGQDGITFTKFKKILKALRKAKAAGALVIYKTISPVDAGSPRFADYGGRANDVIGAFNARAIQLARAEGFCVLDSFRPLMRLLNRNRLLFEPKAIHMLDTGRALTSQLFLNVLRLCNKHEPVVGSTVEWYRSNGNFST